MRMLRFGATMAVALWLAGVSTAPRSQSLLRDYPDQWISQHLLGTSRDAIRPSISDDGRFVAYQGAHPDGYIYTAYVFDRTDPEHPEAVGTDCNYAGQMEFSICAIERPRLSGNGRYVIFDSEETFGANPGVDTDESDRDVFVWDRDTDTTQRISLGVGGAEPNADSYAADISRDGRYLVFTSYATNLVSSPNVFNVSGYERTYWMDRQTGVVKLVYDTNRNDYTYPYNRARLTSNGRYVLAVDEFSTAYCENCTTQPLMRVITWDALNSSVGEPLYGSQVPNGYNVAMTADRRFSTRIHWSAIEGSQVPTDSYVVVQRNTSAYGWNYEYQRYYGGDYMPYPVLGLELSTGAGYLGAQICAFSSGYEYLDVATRDYASLRMRLARISISYGCPYFTGFDMTPDGRYIVVSTYDIGAGPFSNDRDNKRDVYLIENPLWRPSPTNLVAQFTSIPADSRNVKVSTDRRIGVFESEIPASEFGPYSDSNGKSDVFRYLADFQEIELLSTADGSTAFAGGASNPAMSSDGESVMFEAPDAGVAVKNLRPDGTLSAVSEGKATNTTSVFLRRLSQNAPQRISTSRTGGAPNGNSRNPSISPNGRWAAFSTDASNVNPGADPNAVRDVVSVDLQTGERRCVSTCAGSVANGHSDRPSVSNNGDLAFETVSGVVQKAAGLDKATGVSQIVLRNLIGRSSQIISRSGSAAPGNGASTAPSISASGHAVAYQSSASNLDGYGSDGRINVFRYTLGGSSRRLSRRAGPGGKGEIVIDGNNVRPVISGDGRFVAWQTTATNLADVDTNGVTDLIVHDIRTAQLKRVADGFGGEESNGASETPHLNHNGTAIGFHSFASNLSADADGAAANANSAPYARDNPLGWHIVFADTFE